MSTSIPNNESDASTINAIPANATLIDATQGSEQPLEYSTPKDPAAVQRSRERKIWAGLFFSTVFCLVISIVVLATPSAYSYSLTNGTGWDFGYFKVCYVGGAADICGSYSNSLFTSITPTSTTAQAFAVLAVISLGGLFVLIFVILRIARQRLWQLLSAVVCIWIIICHGVALNGMMTSGYYEANGTLMYGGVLQILMCILIGIKALAFFYFIIRGISFKGVCGC